MRYENPTSTSLFAVDPSQTGECCSETFVHVTARDAGLTEGWFQDAIAQNPELVINPCRRSGITDEGWFFWGREVAVSGADGKGIGSIDVLLVSETGRIGIVETKLSYNPERRRSVIAQVLDYALNLNEQDLYDLAPNLPHQDGRSLVNPDAVSQRLRDGNYLLIVAGDVLDPRAVRLGQSMLGDHVLQSWDLALVDMALYRRHGTETGPDWLMVPALRGTLLAETRQVIEVTVEGLPEGASALMKAEPVQPARDTGRSSWNEAKFKKALQSAPVPEAFKELGRRLLAIPGRFPLVVATFGTGVGGALILKLGGHSLLELQVKGMLRCRPRRIRRALPEEISEPYLDSLFEVAGFTHEVYPWAPAESVAPRADEIVELLEETLVQVSADRDRTQS